MIQGFKYLRHSHGLDMWNIYIYVFFPRKPTREKIGKGMRYSAYHCLGRFRYQADVTVIDPEKLRRVPLDFKVIMNTTQNKKRRDLCKYVFDLREFL